MRRQRITNSLYVEKRNANGIRSKEIMVRPQILVNDTNVEPFENRDNVIFFSLE